MADPDKRGSEILFRYREKTFKTCPEIALRNERDAIKYVNERGFILFWPNKDLVFPNLWHAVAGDRPVADNHDDSAHITWRWKDNQLGKKRWYYAKIIRQRSTMVSLDLLPNFYALSPNYGDPEQDYLLSYENGELSSEEKTVYESLLQKGPLDTITLRESAGLASATNNSRFNRALNLLQRDFRIVPIGISDRGAWHYSFIYDVTHRQFPELPFLSQSIQEIDAQMRILKSYLRSLGTSNIQQIKKFFQWSEPAIRKALDGLINNEDILPNPVVDQSVQEWFTIKQLFD